MSAAHRRYAAWYAWRPRYAESPDSGTERWNPPSTSTPGDHLNKTEMVGDHFGERGVREDDYRQKPRRICGTFKVVGGDRGLRSARFAYGMV